MELTQEVPDQEQVEITISSPPLDPQLDSVEELPTDDPILPDNTQIYSSSPPAPAPAIDVDVDDDDSGDDGIDYRDAILPHNTQILSSSPPPTYSSDEDEDEDEREAHSPNPDEMITSSFNSSHSQLYPASYPPPPSSSDPQNQPTFHPAPRFGGAPTEGPEPGTPTPDAAPENAPPVPDIFSPQRARNPRSRRHVPGGMAAELRDWLVEIKENEAERNNGGAPPLGLVRLAVDEIRRDAPPGMMLVAGRVGAGRARAILAGDGEGGTVEEGAVVAISMPAWDVVLEESWAVAYRWEVVGWEEQGGS